MLLIILKTPNQDCSLSKKQISSVIDQIKQSEIYIGNLTDCHKNNRQIISNITELNYHYFDHASDSLKKDEIFIKNVIATDSQILEYISEDLL